jgi:hypothetical protein
VIQVARRFFFWELPETAGGQPGRESDTVHRQVVEQGIGGDPASDTLIWKF